MGNQFVSKTNYGTKIKQIFYYQIQKSHMILKPFQNHDLLNSLPFTN